MTDDSQDFDPVSLGPRANGGDMAKVTAGILFGAAVLARYEGALVSVCVNPEIEEPDVVCWNGSLLSGGPDVIWVWHVRFHPEQRAQDWSHPLSRQIQMAELDLLAHGRPAIPGPANPTPAGGGEHRNPITGSPGRMSRSGHRLIRVM